jgi:hypothetical protein
MHIIMETIKEKITENWLKDPVDEIPPVFVKKINKVKVEEERAKMEQQLKEWLIKNPDVSGPLKIHIGDKAEGCGFETDEYRI